MTRFTQWLIVVLCSGLVGAASFALAAEPLQPMGPVRFSFWIAAGIILVVGVLSALVLVDLKRAFSSALGASLFATIFYVLAIWSPSVSMGQYSTHLMNYALIQAIAVASVTAGLVALGVLIGTIINTSIREYDL